MNYEASLGSCPPVWGVSISDSVQDLGSSQDRDTTHIRHLCIVVTGQLYLPSRKMYRCLGWGHLKGDVVRWLSKRHYAAKLGWRGSWSYGGRGLGSIGILRIKTSVPVGKWTLCWIFCEAVLRLMRGHTTRLYVECWVCITFTSRASSCVLWFRLPDIRRL